MFDNDSVPVSDRYQTIEAHINVRIELIRILSIDSISLEMLFYFTMNEIDYRTSLKPWSTKRQKHTMIIA